jgi:hypothetical protein
MKKRILLVLTLSSLLWNCTNLKMRDYDQIFEDRGQPPVIVDYYATELIRPGSSWRVFLHARDKDGDMEYIAFMLYQAGFGYYSSDYTWLEGSDRGEFAGYVTLRTPAEWSLTSEKFTLTVLVRDRQRNRSESVKLPLGFGYVQPESIPEEWQAAAKHRLGRLVTNIQSLEKIGGGSAR